ncbi:MAG: DUF4062 domain-containing protein [Ignavibacteriales bacterium]|nr:DUF4062 domain-containing protein [Ignavibacteriales bacterium]
MRVFISSTWDDLQEERKVLEKALDRVLIAEKICMEHFGSKPDTPYELCMKKIENAEILIGIYAHRYGSIPSGYSKSMIELEYQKAIKLKIPALIYIADPNTPILYDSIESVPQKKKQLTEFKHYLLNNHTISYFSNPHQLAWMVVVDLMNWLQENQPSQPKQQKISPIVGEVKAWFEAIEFNVEPLYKELENYCDLHIEKEDSDTFMIQSIRVRCKEGKATEQDLIEFCKDIDKGVGWFISSEEPVKLARNFCDKQQRIKVFSLMELINKQIRLKKYADFLREIYKELGISKYYVDLSCFKKDYDINDENTSNGIYDVIDDYIDNWLNADYKNHISILGEFGAGKTWFCWHFAIKQLEQYEKNPLKERFPLVVTLRDYTKAVSVESLFSEFFFRKHQTGITTYNAFIQLNRMGKFLIIFDGFDEMQRKVDYQTVVDNFWELSKVVVPNTKVILTCRTEHFRYEAEAKKIMEGKAESSKKIELEPPKFEVIHLKELSEKQIFQVLAKRLKKNRANKVINILNSKPYLKEMANKPLMIELLLEALPEIEVNSNINMSDVYYYAIIRKLEKDISTKRTFTSMNDKIYFMCELSWEMLLTGELKISYKNIPILIQNYFEDIGKSVKKTELDHWAYDLQNSTLLKRDNQGNYEFVHKSLIEFFVAYKFCCELGIINKKFLLFDSKNKNNRKFKEKIKLPYSSKNLLETFGAKPLIEMPEVAKFINDLAANQIILFNTLMRTKNQTFDFCKYVGTNAATILLQKDPSYLKGTDISHSVLPFTHFIDCDLTGTNLSGADLSHSCFTNAILKNANLSNADLSDVEFTDVSQVFSMAISPNEEFIAVGGGDKYVRVLRLNTLEQIAIFRGHRDWVRNVYWHKNGREIISYSEDNTLRFWDLKTLNQVFLLKLSAKRYKKIRRPLSLSILQDSNLIVAIDNQATIILFDIESKKYTDIFRLKLSTNALYSLIPSKNENHLVISDQQKLYLFDTHNWKLASEIEVANGYICNSDFTLVAAANRTKRIVTIWNLKSGKIINSFDTYELIRSIAIDAKWKKIIISSYNFDSKRLRIRGEPITKIFDIDSGKELMVLSKGKPNIERMKFTRDDKILVCGLMNGKIELWNMDENSKEFGKKFLTSSTFENDFSNTLITNTKGLDTTFNKTIRQWPKEEYYTAKEFLLWNGAKE